MTLDEQIEQVQLHLEWLEAKRDGKPFDVQVFRECTNTWDDVDDPQWLITQVYRRKPREPRRCWVRWAGGQPGKIYPNRFTCEAEVRMAGGECVEMVEVMGDAK